LARLGERTGQISGCTVGASYTSGIYFVVSVYVTGNWALGFANPQWQLKQGESFPVDFTLRWPATVPRFWHGP
jgi:hypothetical protein